MATNKITIREHTTSDIIMRLLSNDKPIDLSGVYAVRLDLIDSLKKVYRYSTVDDPAYLSITNASDGQITLTPPSSSVFEYQRNPYKVYAWVFETVNKKYSVPEKGYSLIELEKEY